MLMGHMNDRPDASEDQDSWDIQTNQIHLPLGGVLLSDYAPALRTLGLLDPVKQQLGRGGFGVAFKIASPGRRNSVLKLTRDPLEVVASWSLRSRKTSHVVPIFEVWSLPKMQQHDHWAGWWAIHRDYLHDFKTKDGNLLETLFDLWKDESLDLSIPKPGNAGRGMREKWRSCMREWTDCSAIEIGRSMLLLDQISKGIQEMSQIGIDWTDILPDNLLLDGAGALRISDVGFGQPRRDIECDPPELTIELARRYVVG